MMEPLLEVRSLTVTIHQREVVQGVSLMMQPGECWALVGPNGAGKSTLLRALIGAVPRTAGDVFIEGRPWSSLSGRDRARRVALVGTEQARDLRLTAREVVALGRLPYLGPLGALTLGDVSIVEEALLSSGCGALSQRLVATLSDGERQRVYFARALAQRPRLLLLDEATAHLDLAHRLETLARVRQFATGAAGAIVIVHDLDLAARYASHVAVLDAGKLVAAGRPGRVFTKALFRDIFRIDAELMRGQHGLALCLRGPAMSTRGDATL